MWKARSQAAYQGYSHLSGMEMMSSFSMWNHSEFREFAISGMERVGVVLVQPVVAVEEEELLAPEHAGEGLAHHVGRVRGDRWRGDRPVELVGFLQPGGEDLVKRLPEGMRLLLLSRADWLAGEPQAHRRRLAGADRQPVVRRDLGALLFGVHRAPDCPAPRSR